jgi:hypothetical protein
MATDFSSSPALVQKQHKGVCKRPSNTAGAWFSHGASWCKLLSVIPLPERGILRLWFLRFSATEHRCAHAGWRAPFLCLFQEGCSVVCGRGALPQDMGPYCMPSNFHKHGPHRISHFARHTRQLSHYSSHNTTLLSTRNISPNAVQPTPPAVVASPVVASPVGCRSGDPYVAVHYHPQHQQ